MSVGVLGLIDRDDRGRHPGPTPSGWVPTSACGSSCLSGDAPRLDGFGVVRASARAVAVVVVLLAGLLVVACPARCRDRALPACLRGLLRAVGVRLQVQGRPWSAGSLVVANHLSWIDVLVLCGVGRVRLLAKREVRAWPVIGAAAARCGSLFVDRAGLRALPATVAAAAAVLRAGSSVAVFPEGTTWCGTAAGRFRPAAFQAALDAGAPVAPVALRLRDATGRVVPAAAFIGEDTLVESMRRLIVLAAARTPVECVVSVLDPLPAVGDRRALADAAAAAIGAVTGVAHPRPVRRLVALAA